MTIFSVRFETVVAKPTRQVRNPRSPQLRGDSHFDGDLIEVDDQDEIQSSRRSVSTNRGSTIKDNNS